jgi:transcriptional regulator of nitric oxide reductase
MTPNAVIRARDRFEGDAVIITGGGRYSTAAAMSGWIRGGVIDANRQPLTGLRVEDLHRLEIADLSVLNALYKGVHLLKGGTKPT